MKFLKDNALILVLVVAVLAAGGSLMVVSQKVYDTQKHVQALDQDILTKQWDIRALKAELAYLSRPDRLEQISVAIAKSEPVQSGQSPISAVSYQVSRDLPPAMSLLPPVKPSSAVYHKPRRGIQQVAVTIQKKNTQAVAPVEKTVAKETSKPQPVQKQAGFSSLIDRLGDAQ